MFKALYNAIEWRLTELLWFALTFVVVLAMLYIGVAEMTQQERKYNTCIAAGNQYINGNCVK
jgi:hypothetical protein